MWTLWINLFVFHSHPSTGHFFYHPLIVVHFLTHFLSLATFVCFSFLPPFMVKGGEKCLSLFLCPEVQAWNKRFFFWVSWKVLFFFILLLLYVLSYPTATKKLFFNSYSLRRHGCIPCVFHDITGDVKHHIIKEWKKVSLLPLSWNEFFSLFSSFLFLCRFCTLGWIFYRNSWCFKQALRWRKWGQF